MTGLLQVSGFNLMLQSPPNSFLHDLCHSTYFHAGADSGSRLLAVDDSECVPKRELLLFVKKSLVDGGEWRSTVRIVVPAFLQQAPKRRGAASRDTRPLFQHPDNVDDLHRARHVPPWKLPSERFPKKHSKSILVNLFTEAASFKHLWRHVRRCSSLRILCGYECPFFECGYAKVGNLSPTSTVKQHIGALEVPMNYGGM